MKLFKIKMCGDPYNETGWDILEYEKNFDEQFPIFHGDLSPHQGKDSTIAMLRKFYPKCKIRIS